jgi:hypothetical protein
LAVAALLRLSIGARRRAGFSSIDAELTCVGEELICINGVFGLINIDDNRQRRRARY